MPASHSIDPAFLSARTWTTVICHSTEFEDWCMADLIQVDGRARNPKVPSLLQIIDVGSGVIRWVCDELFTHIAPDS